MTAPFERLNPEGVAGLPSEGIRGLVIAGIRELTSRGEPLPAPLDQPAIQRILEETDYTPSPISLADGRIQVFPNYGGVEIDGQKKHLEQKVYAALFCLAAKADQLVTLDELIDACWPQAPPKTRNCRNQIIRRLRVALGSDDLGDTEWGVIRTIRTVKRRGWIALTSLREDHQRRFDEARKLTAMLANGGL